MENVHNHTLTLHNNRVQATQHTVGSTIAGCEEDLMWGHIT